MALYSRANNWIVVRAQFEDDNLDTVIRFRTGMPSSRIRRSHPIMTIIKWPYPAKKDGMPRQADMKRMAAFEDALETAIENSDLGIATGCLTGNGRRTWRHFVADPVQFRAALHPLLKTFGTEPFLFKQIDDVDWDGLKELMPLLDCECDE